MALVKCKECGSKVSTGAKACPNCGAKPPKKTSLFTWLVVIFMLIVAYNSITMTPEERTAISERNAAEKIEKEKQIAILRKKADSRIVDVTASDDYKKYSKQFQRAAKKILSLFKCTEHDITSEGFTRSQNYKKTYFVNCTDNMDRFGFAQYHLNVETDDIYLKKDGRLAKINF